MRLILIGPPGSGKGTQAQLLAARQQLCAIGMGDLLREAVRQGTPAGQQAAPYVQRGELVPDRLVNQLFAEHFHRHPACAHRFVLEGYPRTRAQAEALEQLLDAEHLRLDAVVQLVVPDEDIVQRLSGRRICPQCHASYHLMYHPPRVPGRCDQCGAALLQRADDREEIVRQRLRIYHQTYGELLRYYQERGLLVPVPGQGEIEAVYQRLLQAVQALAGRRGDG